MGLTNFDLTAYGTPNPVWTKRKGARLEALADHICTRTPPFSYHTPENVFIEICRRNTLVLGTWVKGYQILTDMVIDRLIDRDGRL